jgi:hypothetical protein
MVAVGVVLAAAATGCGNDNLTNLNKNPNSPEDVSAGPIFTRGVYTSVNRFLGSGFDLRQTEFVAQHMSEVSYPSDDTYGTLLGANVGGTFTAAYSADLEDLKQVVKKGDAATNPAISEPARVMQSWIFENLTDAWGDVPYVGALAGDSVGSSYTPAYDPQKDIYAGVMATLTSASTNMASASDATLIGAADPIYQGKLASWEKFANSLHARMALRLVNVDAATSSAELAKAFAAPGGLITSNAEAAKLVWPGNGTYDNPWSINFQTRDDNRISLTLYNILSPAGGPVDPRLPIYAQPTQANPAAYNGAPNGTGSTATQYTKTTSRPGTIFYSGAGAYGIAGTAAANAKTASYLMTAAEVKFIQAEAAERSLGGLSPSQAAGFYNAGILASMDQWGVATAAANAYVASPSVVYQGGVAGLKQIAIQKWIALYGDGAQAWASFRRTCQPATIQAGPAAVVKYVPRRFPYAIPEISVNGANVTAAASRLGGTKQDNFGGMFYWDQPQNAPTCQGVNLNLP